MAKITVDKREYQVHDGQNLLSACLSLGFDLPYFCWHPALGSCGACRQCAIVLYKDADDTQGKLTMACMNAAADGTHLSIEAPMARQFRASVIEWLMINHPHDCPVCEEGGECHLQDMTHMTGHVYRRYRFTKRTHHNQYLGPFIGHEMNRCIACYRCVRFYKDYAGGHDLEVQQWHDKVYFGRATDGVLESEFSGNLAEVCPTGVFTDKTLGDRYTRKWDLRSSPSICNHCGLGCNTSPNERYGAVKRILNRYNDAVNGYFICDRGRFGYDYVNGEQRIFQPWQREDRNQRSKPITHERALEWLSQSLRDSTLIGIGSPRASVEANFALRQLVGAEQFHDGLSDSDHHLIGLILDIMRAGDAHFPTMRETEKADAVLVLGEDLNNSAPRLALSLLQATRQASFRRAEQAGVHLWHDPGVREATPPGLRSPLFIATPAATRLDEHSSGTFHGTPDDIARLGFAVAHALDDASPAVADLDDDMRALATDIADALRDAERPLVVSGPGCHSEAIIQAAANVARALQRREREDQSPACLLYTVPEANSLGVRLLDGRPLTAAFEKLRNGSADTVIVMENDLFRRHGHEEVRTALAAARRVIVIDSVFHATTAAADLILPAATFAETDGTLINNEARAQRFYAVLEPNAENDVQASWRWLSVIATRSGRAEGIAWLTLDQLIHACADAMPVLQGIREAAPPARYRIADRRLAREPHRYSGRTAMYADRSVHEPQPPRDPDTPFSYTMEGHYGEAPSPLIPFFWAPGWNSVQSLNKFQAEIDGPLRGGDSGTRLIEPRLNTRARYGGRPPAAFKRRGDALRALPLYEVFGSDELSALSPPLAERIPEPYIALHADDAAALKLDDSDHPTVLIGQRAVRLRVRIDSSLARGTAGIPAGLEGLTGLALPAWAELRAATSGAEPDGEGL